jgi:hypothetical protein
MDAALSKRRETMANATAKEITPAMCTRGEVYVQKDGEHRVHAHLHVSKQYRGRWGHETATGKILVHWNCNRGNGWMKGWKATFDTIEEAAAFAAAKLLVLADWCDKTEVVETHFSPDFTCRP